MSAETGSQPDVDAFFRRLAGKSGPAEAGSTEHAGALADAARAEILSAEAWNASFLGSDTRPPTAEDNAAAARLMLRLRESGHLPALDASAVRQPTRSASDVFDLATGWLQARRWAMPLAFAASLTIAVLVVVPTVDDSGGITRSDGIPEVLVDDATVMQARLVAELEAAGASAVAARVRTTPPTWRIRVEAKPGTDPEILRAVLARAGVTLALRDSLEFDLKSRTWLDRLRGGTR